MEEKYLGKKLLPYNVDQYLLNGGSIDEGDAKQVSDHYGMGLIRDIYAVK